MAKSSIPYYQPTGNETLRLVKSGFTLLHDLEVENPNTSQMYIQLFDAAATSAVTLGTTTPAQTYVIPAGDGTENGVRTKEFGDAALRFGLGLVWAITTTRSGSTGPGTACPTNLRYD